MKTQTECMPCFMNQALRAAKTATDKDDQIWEALNKTGELLQHVKRNSIPAETGEKVYRLVQDITGQNDLYASEKQESIREALNLLPEIEKRIKNAPDPLMAAIRTAIAGNVIDFGVNKAFDLKKDWEQIFTQNFAAENYSSFKKKLAQAKNVLYIGDNAGESVLDRVLIKQLKRPVKYAVREKPIINDLTYKEALESGLDKDAEIISSGATAAGTILKQCSESFRKLFYEADMVISKGQGNYEGLSDAPRQVFFLLKAKCTPVARQIGVPENGIVLLDSQQHSKRIKPKE